MNAYDVFYKTSVSSAFFSWKPCERELKHVGAASPAEKYIKPGLCSKSKDVISVPHSGIT